MTPAKRTTKRRWRSLIAPGLATLVALSILLALGFWQLERKVWKEDLLAQIAARAHNAPGAIVAEPDWPRWRAADDEFRRVRVQGRFMPEATVAIHGLAEERRGQALQGYYLFVPLRLDDGATVVINRGFVPTERLSATLADPPDTKAPAEVTGLVRNPETRGLFVPENEPDKNRWFVRSLKDIVSAKHLERVAPFYIDAGAAPNPGGWPRGGQTQLTLRNNHFGYALTWFGLAATLVGVFATFARHRLAGSPGELQADDPRDDEADTEDARQGRWIA